MALGISEAVSLSGRVLDLVKQGTTIDLQERIMELREAVLNVREELLTLREENGALKRAASEREQLTFDGAVYWHEDDEGVQQGPFCQKCHDADGKTVRLQKCQPEFHFTWTCNVCHMHYVRRG
jgi:hypothetical protein